MSESSSLVSPAPSVSLDGVASPFFSSLQGCRDTFFISFEGLSKLSAADEIALEQGQPLFYQRAEGVDQSHIVARAKTHLFCIALNEVRKINSNFFSELRRFLEFNRIGRLDISTEDKQSAFARVLEAKNEKIFTLAEQIGSLLPSGFGYSKELKSLDVLEMFFSQIISSQGDLGKLPQEIEVDLFRAELQVEDGIYKPSLNVLPSNRKVSRTSVDSIDLALIQEIFFTPYAIGIHLLQSTQKYLSNNP
jgi:hypothetical protein